MIYLMRHGLDDEDYIGGHSDIGLVEEGKKEVIKSAEFIRDNLGIKQIITSDVRRSVETSKIVLEVLKKDLPFQLDASLRELDKGVLTGRRKDSLSDGEREMLKTKDISFRYPSGESMLDMYNRVKELLNSNYFDNKDQALIVTHRGIINMLYFILNNEELSMDKEKFSVFHGSIHELDLAKKKIKKIY